MEVASLTPRPFYTRGKGPPVSTEQEGGCATETIWTTGKSRHCRDDLLNDVVSRSDDTASKSRMIT